MRPLSCAVFPHLGARHPKGYFDTGTNLGIAEEHIYVSVEAVEYLARELGWQGPEQIKESEQAYESLERENALLRDQLADADRFAEAAEYTLGRFGQHVRNKPGRKPKSAQEA